MYFEPLAYVLSIPDPSGISGRQAGYHPGQHNPTQGDIQYLRHCKRARSGRNERVGYRQTCQ